MNDKRLGLPKVTPMPAPPRPPEPPRRNNSEAVYAEEALRVAQRHLDQVDEINRLGIELDEWRRRALMAEAECKRLEKREQDLVDAMERQAEKLMNERDIYRNKLNNFQSQFHTVGAVILKCIDATTVELGGGSNVNLGTLAQEIERAAEPEGSEKTITTPEEPDEPLPRIVAAGPREP
jgi:hypothetical protein